MIKYSQKAGNDPLTIIIIIICFSNREQCIYNNELYLPNRKKKTNCEWARIVHNKSAQTMIELGWLIYSINNITNWSYVLKLTNYLVIITWPSNYFIAWQNSLTNNSAKPNRVATFRPPLPRRHIGYIMIVFGQQRKNQYRII